MAIELSNLTFTEQDDVVPASGVDAIVNTGIANTLAGNDIINATNTQYSGQFFKRDAMASASNAYAINHRSEKSECNLNPK
jgi:hypothetical protein